MLGGVEAVDVEKEEGNPQRRGRCSMSREEAACAQEVGGASCCASARWSRCRRGLV